MSCNKQVLVISRKSRPESKIFTKNISDQLTTHSLQVSKYVQQQQRKIPVRILMNMNHFSQNIRILHANSRQLNELSLTQHSKLYSYTEADLDGVITKILPSPTHLRINCSLPDTNPSFAYTFHMQPKDSMSKLQMVLVTGKKTKGQTMTTLNLNLRLIQSTCQTHVPGKGNKYQSALSFATFLR